MTVPALAGGVPPSHARAAGIVDTCGDAAAWLRMVDPRSLKGAFRPADSTYSMSTNPWKDPRWLRAVPIVIVLSIAMAAEYIGLGENVDRRVHDAFIRLTPSSLPTVPSALPDVAVVAIDPRSLRASESWPWRRSTHARAVDALIEAGARAIAFDIDFSSPSTPEEDARLAERLRAGGRVVLATFSQTQRLEGGAELEIVNRPIPRLEQAADGLGSVLVPIDPDGVVRHAPRASEIGGIAIPSLARSTLAVAAPATLRGRIDEARRAHDATRIDYRRHWPAIPTVAYIDLIEGRFDPADLAGRAVFIGATAAEFQDLWPTPPDPALPGVMIQAIAYRTAAAEAMGDGVLGRAPFSVSATLLLGLLALTQGPTGRRTFTRLALFAFAGSAVLGAGWAALWFANVLLPVAIPLGFLAARYALGIERLQQHFLERVQAQESSLVALARLGSATQHDPAGRQDGPSAGLDLALELLGDVVDARGVVLIRSLSNGTLTREHLEWRPHGDDDEGLAFDEACATRALERRKTIETDDETNPGARIVYAPLVTGPDAVGVLVVFGRRGRRIDATHSRTIATVGAQLALTAQNLRLIERLRETFESSIAAVAGAVEARDGYTDQHCRRLAAFSSLMGARLGMPEGEIRAMELGALLHDVGKIGIPDAILNKPGRLSNDERSVMESHPEIGAGIVAPVVGLEETTLHCVIHHHERWDGAGYPEGLAGDEIPLAARIVSIVDVWDALSTKRPYKKAFSQAEVRDILVKGRGTQFDPVLVDLFFEVLHEQGDEMLELIARSSGQASAE